MHEYTVELRIIGEDLVPSAVSKELGLRPSTVREVGEAVGSKCFTQAVWGFNGSDSDSPPIWESLEDGLSSVLAKLGPVKAKLRNYRNRFDLIWWCGHFQSSFDGGPTLSASLLKDLGDFGVPLFIDNYLSDGSENGPEQTQSGESKNS